MPALWREAIFFLGTSKVFWALPLCPNHVLTAVTVTVTADVMSKNKIEKPEKKGEQVIIFFFF